MIVFENASLRADGGFEQE
ncbi:hypothetical protein A2U01_0089223, partial [Trifolium medium]|nr:hypothetical protein [Trifolium medium]